MASVYRINKGVGRPVLFQGLKGQYIAWFCAGLVGLLVCFAVLYVMDVRLWLLLPLVFGLGLGIFRLVFYLNGRFGEHGLEKLMAARRMPASLRFSGRRLFTGLRYAGFADRRMLERL
ncbi:DUF4133 domain-containing protein [Pedobacter sp. HMF7647]|uniref:DUF4133 domain-containing protein n=1 Tax=Hufsiella arboris TaxID=2695275 RepID=A0A7K1Y780_9SPHI|nr:DUF4133 domain-containing protein [Hufsiella arboris]MXV50424.1 DUF4133 domain-containing protein [Hufsiella arboris]